MRAPCCFPQYADAGLRAKTQRKWGPNPNLCQGTPVMIKYSDTILKQIIWLFPLNGESSLGSLLKWVISYQIMVWIWTEMLWKSMILVITPSKLCVCAFSQVRETCPFLQKIDWGKGLEKKMIFWTIFTWYAWIFSVWADGRCAVQYWMIFEGSHVEWCCEQQRQP